MKKYFNSNELLKMSFFMFMLSATFSVFGQGKYFTREGNVQFKSEATMEKIEAKNNKVSSAVDSKTGKVEFAVLIKSFHFEKALMQEHFNENYMESDKFPKATFAGTITNLSDINFGKDGSYKATVKGKMTIHGVTKDVSSTGTIKVSKGAINVTNSFKILLADYGIEIPSVLKDKISKEVEVAVNSDYKAM